MTEAGGTILKECVEALAHSIWIGCLLVLAYFIFVKLEKNLSPARKVWCGLSFLGLIPVLSVAFALRGFFLPFSTKFSVTVPAVVFYLVFWGWIVGMIPVAIRIALNLKRTKALRSGLFSASESVVGNVIRKARARIKMPRQIQIYFSEKIAGPLLTGFFRPAIVLPVSFLEEKRQAITAILAHETAHFLRNDLWFQLGQILVETVFFFHPPVRWLSSEIRKEREMACDDLAVELMGGKQFAYAAALLGAEEKAIDELPCSSSSIAFGGDSTSDRAVRIALGEHGRQNAACRRTLGTLILLLFTIVAFSAISMVRIQTNFPQTFEFPVEP